jgi:crotonobetainyl-CoA:carnitine CoA-transferase CaiB-like acyl-CoA transferase
MVVETDHPHFGRVRQVAGPVRVGDEPQTWRSAPRRHEAADHVLQDLLGYDESGVAELTEKGAFGPRTA